MSNSSHRGALTKVAIHQSLVRPMLFMGGDRTLVILSLLFSVYLGYLITMRYGIWWGVPIGGVLWCSAIYCLREMAIADPNMWAVLQRAKQYRAFYPARGRFDAPLPAIKDFK
jgi:type IV secretion system protein VirB3